MTKELDVKKPTLFDYFLLSRPYTLPSIVLVAILANSLARNQLVPDLLTLLDVIFALSTWSTVMYLNEALKKKLERPPVPYAIPILFFLISLGIALSRNYLSVFFLAIAILTSVMYWLKSKNWVGSPFVFFVRGGTEVSIFLGVLLFYNFAFSSEILNVALILLLITDSRNLIGDIRDSQFDKYTFPKKFGTSASRALSIVLLFLAIILTPTISISFPLSIMIILIVAISDGYLLHQLFVPTSAFFLINLAASTSTINLFFINFSYIATMLAFTYTLVPRVANMIRKK